MRPFLTYLNYRRAGPFVSICLKVLGTHVRWLCTTFHCFRKLHLILCPKSSRNAAVSMRLPKILLFQKPTLNFVHIFCSVSPQLALHREYEIFPEAQAQLSVVLNCSSSLSIDCCPHPVSCFPSSRTEGEWMGGRQQQGLGGSRQNTGWKNLEQFWTTEK